MKNKFISRLLSLVAIMVLLYSCRNELTTEQEIYNNSSQFRPTSKTIRLEQSKHKSLLKTELQKAQNNLTNIKTNALGKTVDYANGVSIDTDNVTYIESGPTFHTYTFNLVRENAPEDAPLENLVLSSLPDGSYKELLVTYNFTQQEKLDLLSGKGVKTADRATAIELAKGTYGGVISNRSMGVAESCSYQTVDMYFSCYTGEHHQGNESSWGSCNWQNQGGYPAQHITVVALVCTADTSLGIDGAPGGGTGSGDGGGLGGGSNTETPTIPTLSRFFFYAKKLPVDLKTILYDMANTEFYDTFQAFFDLNGGSIEAQNFITLCLQANLPSTITTAQFKKFFLDGYTLDFHNKLSLLSVSEIQDYVAINLEIENSPYDEEYIKETNEAFVAFTSYADIETMTEAQMGTVLNQCCPSIIIVPQNVIHEKTKMIIANYHFNRKFYPEWSKAKCFWKASGETIQLLLDLGGLVPVIGEVCDLTNGVIYTIQGDGLNASLSYASAIPIAGWFATGSKFGVKVMNASDIASRQVLKWVVGTDGLIKFGYSNQLRKVLKLTDKAKQAHHIIPWAYNIQTHPIVQKAAKSMNAFHLNEALNGIAVASWRNQPNHHAYNNRIFTKLQALPSNLTAEQSYVELMKIINQAKQAIINNPNTHLNDLVF
ncbi:hypothetical protein CQ046_03170 [Chryseobacterium sp. MYb7]|uniref:AHH domain-containing protein n=1 Tax=Chryseobacterium sp. MYb7 TaxID=1827290 RepID=UPI000CFEDCC5|nr:hypothetical protein [Chryseobacterium sp. MYb7]PRB06183.1 hypothetical protein CQ046_03170 [Chryseobacterium sp. MYb7]